MNLLLGLTEQLQGAVQHDSHRFDAGQLRGGRGHRFLGRPRRWAAHREADALRRPGARLPARRRDSPRVARRAPARLIRSPRDRHRQPGARPGRLRRESVARPHLAPRPRPRRGFDHPGGRPAPAIRQWPARRPAARRSGAPATTRVPRRRAADPSHWLAVRHAARPPVPRPRPVRWRPWFRPPSPRAADACRAPLEPLGSGRLGCAPRPFLAGRLVRGNGQSQVTARLGVPGVRAFRSASDASDHAALGILPTRVQVGPHGGPSTR